jgi:UDP-N-acetylglucosamine 2-epimerase
MISLFYPDVVALGHDLQHVLDLGRPGYILVGNDLTWEGRLLSRLARRQNYRLGMIQHGLVGHERINGYHIVNDFFVYGPASKTVLEEDGLENVNIVVSGAPYLDEIRVDDADEPHPLIRERLRLPGRFVLVALSGFGHRTSLENYQLTLEWIDRLIRSHPELDFVIKLHRKEQMGAYSMFSDEQKVRIIDSKRGRRYPQSIFDWLRGCSCLITGTSTVAYEAMLFNIPVISVDPVKQFKGVDFVEQRAAEVVHSYDELEQALLRVNGKRGLSDEFIRKIFGGNEVPASEQIASFIVNALGNQQN